MSNFFSTQDAGEELAMREDALEIILHQSLPGNSLPGCK